MGSFDRFSPANLVAKQPVINVAMQVAKRKNATPAQVALAWLLAQKPWIVPIPGTRNVNHLGENLEAVNVRLTAADVRGIDSALEKVTIHGGRMNAPQMLVVD